MHDGDSASPPSNNGDQSFTINEATLRHAGQATASRGGCPSFDVGLTFVRKMLRQHRETGDLRPRPHGGGQTRRLSEKHLKLLRQEVSRDPDKTAASLRDHLEERAGVVVSRPTVTRALRTRALAQKKRWRRVSATRTSVAGTGGTCGR